MHAPKSPAAHRLAGVVTVLATLFGWSSVPLFVWHFSHSIDAWTSNGWRYGFAALLWAPLLLVGAARRTLPPRLFRAAIVPALFNATGQVAFTSAHYLIDPGLLTFGMRLQIVFVAIGAAVLFPSERAVVRSPRFLFGLALVFAGTACTVALDPSFGERSGLLGVGLAVVAGLMFAGYGLSVRRYMHGFPPLPAFAAISQLTAGAMVSLMLLFGDRRGAVPFGLSASEMGLLLLSSVIGIALGHVFYYVAIARLGVALSSGILQLQPVLVAIAAGWLFPGQALLPLQWATGSLAVTGAMILLLAQSKVAPAEAPRAEGSPVDLAEAGAEPARAAT